MLVSRICKATNFSNSAFTLYALLKRSGLYMTAFICKMITHPPCPVQALKRWEQEEQAGAGAMRYFVDACGFLPAPACCSCFLVFCSCSWLLLPLLYWPAAVLLTDTPLENSRC